MYAKYIGGMPSVRVFNCRPALGANPLNFEFCLWQAEGVSDFEWSPKDNVLAYWAPEQANAPARVSVVEIPSRKELRQKNLVMVSECRLHWQVRTNNHEVTTSFFNSRVSLRRQ